MSHVARWKRWAPTVAIAPLVSLVVLLVNGAGVFQLLDWAAYDGFLRARPGIAKDTRIILVTVRETDIKHSGQWPLPDRTLAQLLEKIKRHRPRVIGLDLYRDFPVNPGKAELEQIFRSTPNLIGIEKGVGKDTVSPPRILVQTDQVSLADLVLDEDGKVRRGLFSITRENGEAQFGLAAKLVLTYLAQDGILPQTQPDGEQIRWGKATLRPLNPNDGGYVNADTGGYQILLNYRGPRSSLTSVSMLDVLRDRIPADLLRDRIVLIGSEAISLNDFFITPYDFLLTPNHQENRTPGIFIHAQFASQLLDATLGNPRALVRVLPEPLEWLWAIACAGGGVALSCRLLQPNFRRRAIASGLIGIVLVIAGSGLVTLHCGLLLAGWWVPIMAPLISLWGAALVSMAYHHQRLQQLVSSDHLTQVANRRYFDYCLAQELREDRPLSLVLCDVDYFKNYNDTYGHQAGDECLKQVAAAIRQASRQMDLVARYGGEEFAVVLPNTPPHAALQVAERIRQQVIALGVPHQGSLIQPYITLSCGVITAATPCRTSQVELVTRADAALYQAKAEGRDRIIAHQI